MSRLTLEGSGLSLHEEANDDVDPVTAEVIRHNLWNINIEHGNAIVRASGSPICAYGHDFNPCILTEDAEFVYYGPYIQFLASSSDLVAKWIMSNRIESPGVTDGDMFLCNDPWVGTTHQMDVSLHCPVFVDGRLFCWVANTIHQSDVGGSTPGSFCQDASDVFDESIPIPPMRIVEKGVLRRDLEEVYLRRSRQPELLALDLRAAISGNTIGRRRILSLVDRYGAATVKGVMRRIIKQSEDTFIERLERLPDGVWRERAYIESAFPGDRGVYRVALEVTKRGRTLHFSNKGTDPQAGALNATAAGWRGALINALSIAFCYDLMYAIGGPLRHVEFDPIPGTLSAATFPAAVSNAPAAVIPLNITLAGNCLSRLMHRDEEQRRRTFTSAAASVVAVGSMHAINQWGEAWAGTNLETMGGGIGAFSHKDGIPTGGTIFDLRSRRPDAEVLESVAPLLYLYRREARDSGGAGRFARGVSTVTAFVCHGSEALYHNIAGSGVAVPTGIGLYGGHPGATNQHLQRLATDIKERFAAGRIPSDIRELSGREYRPDVMATDVRQGVDDVHEVRLAGGAGFGDPLLREPARVAEDVSLGYLSDDGAERLYGVVLADAEVAEEATQRRRAEIRRQRVGGQEPVALSPVDGVRVAEYLVLSEGSDTGRLQCRMCGYDLCSVGENYKEKTRRVDLPITSAGELFCDPSVYVDARFEFRQFFCPACGVLIETEIAAASDGLLREIELL